MLTKTKTAKRLAPKVLAMAALPLAVVLPSVAMAQTEQRAPAPTLEAPATQPTAPALPEAIELTPPPTTTGQPAGDLGADSPDASTAEAPAGIDANPDEGDQKQAATDDLVGRKVIAADGKSVGKVAAVKSDDAGRVMELHVKTGGFLGFGAVTRVLTPDVFVETPEAIQLRVASTDINQLPELSKIEAPKS
ncbi:MAG: PRC-barrel domain-containing protein [Pseudomonadota bacterium]